MGGSRGEKGIRTPPPLVKSQAILVSIGNEQLDPPTPLQIVGPPENVGSPLEPRKMMVFYGSNRWSSVK